MNMSKLGFVIKREHVREAISKASKNEQSDLEQILGLVEELDDLERTLPKRVQEAQASAGIAKPAPGKSAQDAVSQSHDAALEIDRLLTRECNRATTAVDVISEILAMAKLDMKETNVVDNWIAEDDPTKPIYAERYKKIRALVDSLRSFIATHQQ